MEDRAVRFQKITVARRAVALAPGATARMAIGAQIAQTEPAPVVTTGMRTAVHGGIDCTRTPVGRYHGGRQDRRSRFGRRGIAFTQGAMRLVRQSLEGCGCVRAEPLGFEGLRQCRRGRRCHQALGPGEVQQDDEPDECEQDHVRDKMM